MRRGSPHFPYPLIVALFALCPVLSPTAKAQAASAPAAAPVLVMNGLGKGPAPLEGKWQFRVGDDLAWASPQVDDSSWEQLTADQPWGAQGHGSAAEATDAAVDFGQNDDFTVLTLTRLVMGEQSTVVHSVPMLVFVQA